MIQTRRQWLKTGAMLSGVAGLVSGMGMVEEAPAQALPDGKEAFPNSPMNAGKPPGQTLPPEAINGPWRNLRAVQEKKVIDIHTHCWETPVQGNNYKEEGHIRDLDQFKEMTDDLIASMDKHGIARACLTADFVPFETYERSSYKKHPDRFIRTAARSTEAIRDAQEITPETMAQVIREQCQKGAKMVGETFPMLGVRGQYTQKDLKPIVDVILEYDVPVQIHTGWSAIGPAIGFGHGYSTAWRWAEDLGAAMAAYPDVKYILAHTGGRFDELDGMEALRLAFSFDNAYVDTAKSTPRIVSEAVRGIGAERVLFGSDWNRPEMKTYGPYHMRNVYQHWYNLNVIAMSDISDDQRDQILYKSTTKLLKLDKA